MIKHLFLAKTFLSLVKYGKPLLCQCKVDRRGQCVKRAIRIRCGRKMSVPSTFLYPHANSLA